MVAKNVDSNIAGVNTLLTSTADTFSKNTGLAGLPKFRDHRPSSLAFSAELHEGNVRTKGSPVGQDMAERLNQLRKHYKPDPNYVARDRGLRMLDDRHSVFHLQSTPAAAVVLKSSRTLMAHPATLASPGRAHLGQISGIQTTSEGRQYRLIKQQLYRFEPQTLSWIAEKDVQKYSRIGLTGEGLLMKVPQGLCDRSVDGKAQVSLEQSVDGSTLHLQRSAGDGGTRFTPVSESGEPVQLTRIGLAGEVLYASTPAGELLSGKLSTLEGGCLKMRLEPLEELERWHRGSVSFKGFMHDDEGRLNALLLDSYQQLHSCPLTERPHLVPGWNLSDVLLNVIDKGVPEPGLQALAGAVDLGPRGKVALEGGTLLSWDPSAQCWDDTDQVDVDYLTRGLDGCAYVLQAGQLHALGTTTEPVRVSMGASYDLASPNAARPRVTLDAMLAANAQQVITGFAVQDGRHFVSLDQTNQLRAHIDGKETLLMFAEPKDIQALALDRLGNLYAQSSGELLKLDKAHWQSPSSSTMAWEPVPLPGNERLTSLRMGSDQRLIASWGENNAQLSRWGEKYRQLNISDQGAMQWKAVERPARKDAPLLPVKLSQGEVKSNIGSTSWAVTNVTVGQKTEGIAPVRGLLKGFRAHIQPLESLKSFGRDIQHRVKGRKGLGKLYDADQALRGLLPKPLANLKPATRNMETRLDLLSGRELTQAMASTLKAELVRVEKNSQSSAIKLGDLQGAEIVPLAAAAGVRRDKGVLSQMRQVFENLSPSTSNTTAALLRSYEAQNVELSPWKPEETRDLKNPAGLVESGLVHDAQTLLQLSQLITELEGYAPDLLQIADSLKTLMQGYDDNPVHKIVLQNINGYDQAEALYKNFKLLSRDLGTPGSALNFHIARTLGLSEEGSVKQALLQEIQHSESGQSITPNREKTKGVSLQGYGMPTARLLDFTVGASRASGHGVTITRTDKGANIEIKANTTHGVKGAIGVGDTLFPVTGRLGGGLRVGAEAALSYARDKGTSINFNVKQADFPKMMAFLTGEGGDVYDLLDIGTEHTTGNSVKNSVDLNLSAIVQRRSYLNMLEDAGGVDSLVRAVEGGSLNLNLAHWENSRTLAQGQDAVTRGQGSDFQLLNKGGLTLGRGLNSLTGVKAEPGAPTLGTGTSCETSLSVSFDRTKTRVFNVKLKQPPAVKQEQVSELQASLLSFFAPNQIDLPPVFQASAGIGEQLKRLQVFFDNAPVPRTRPEEHFALKNQLQNLVRQHRLVSEDKRELASVESTMTCVGLDGDAKHSWLDDAAPANKAAIVALMKKQPQLMQMLNDLKSSKGTSVSIGLEVKPDALRFIEDAVTNGADARSRVESALKNPDNLRVKSMSVSYKTSRTHSVGLSLPVVSFTSSAGLTHSRKVFNAELEYGANPDAPLSMTRNAVLTVSEDAGLDPEFREQNIRTARRQEYK